MGFFSRFLNAITLDNDIDDDDDYLDDEQDDLDDDDDDLYEKPKAGRRFFGRFRSEDPDDDLDDLDDLDNDRDYHTSRTSKKKPAFSSSRTTSRPSASTAETKRSETRKTFESTKKPSFNSGRKDRFGQKEEPASEKKSFRSGRNQKVTPIRKRDTDSTGMEVSVIRPSSMEDTREIADTLMQKCTVVLNLEGLDVDIAQRVIDFSCGVCYSLNGNLQKVSSYIFILTPENVDISGDFQSILSGAFNLPAMMSGY